MLWRAEPWPCSSPLRSPDPLQYFELCFVVRESTGWAAEQTDRRLPGFPLQAAGASVRSFKFCLCIKEEQNNNRLTWLLVDFMSPPQNDIQNSMEWGCALRYPQLARLQGNLNVDLWEKDHLDIIFIVIAFFFQPDLSEELFTQFTEQLVSQGPQFTKSVKFAKMMLTVLTKYVSYVSL